MKNKGFTLVEMMAVLVILSLLIGIGILTVNNIQKGASENYYHSMEDTLKIAGNDYFADNRGDRPIDDYNYVTLETLQDHEYLEKLRTYDKKSDCDSSSGVFIYNTDDGTDYEVCLKCGDFHSNGPYCTGNVPGQIMITGRTDMGRNYNPLLSYIGAPWAKASSVDITFRINDASINVTKYEIYNSNNNSLFDTCNVTSGKSCTEKISASGSFYVMAYDDTTKVANRKYFNVKLDNANPTFDFKDRETIKELGEGFEFKYMNEIINIHDDNGYKSVTYTLENLDNGTKYASNEDITENNLEILHSLPSGRYKLSARVTDYAGNYLDDSIEFHIQYIVNLVFFDNNEKKHELDAIKVYHGGLYSDLPMKKTISSKEYDIDWYDNSSFIGDVYTSETTVEKSSTHILYGKEKRIIIPTSDYPVCNNEGNFTYNGEVQELVTAKQGYTLTNNTHTDASVYTIIAMPEPNYTWEDGTRTFKMLQCEIKPYTVDFDINGDPCVSNLVYNSKNQYIVDLTGVKTNKDNSLSCVVSLPNKEEVAYSASPISEKDAGTYNVTYTLNSNKNYKWSDGSTTDKVFKCSIGKYPAKFPDDCSIHYGGLTNQGGHKVGMLFEAFTNEIRTIEATPTKIKTGNASLYEANVDFSTVELPNSKFKISNYYIAESPIDCTIEAVPITIVADSDKKVYDGSALTKNSYTQPTGVVSALGDTINSVTVTGSQTNVGSSSNVPSEAVIKNGSTTVTSYYNITYENGTLEVYDDVKPTCSLSISLTGVITASVSDNHQLAYYGFSSSYSGDNTTTKTVYSAGSKTYYVKDVSGNTNTCSIAYDKVKQKRTASCKQHESCQDASCGTCGGGCNKEETNFWCETAPSGYQTLYGSECTREYNGTKDCDTGPCWYGKKCVDYNSTYNCSCVNNNCDCSEWNDFGDWTDLTGSEKCKSGTTKTTETECRTIYRKK